jgi:prepilin-type N-terminal cleavage/methylation domain-containing protein
MKKTNTRKSLFGQTAQGFTIVEIMIVLAIAGLILLIVFEAIPNLTRNSRNNTRKQDVTNILQVISQYELNNSGNFPAGCGNGYSAFCKTSSTTSLLYYTTLTYYIPTSDQVTIHPQTETSAVPIAPATGINNVTIYNYEKCSDGQDTATNVGADYSDIVAMYAVESGGSVPDSQCQEL